MNIPRLVILFVVLISTCFISVSQAIDVCHDYTIYRVALYVGYPQYKAPDNSDTSVSGLKSWLHHAAQYKQIYGWRVMDARPIALRPGDVIIKNVGNGHSGFVNQQGTIDHFLQVYVGMNRLHYSKDSIDTVPTVCPDESTSKKLLNTCGGWRYDRYFKDKDGITPLLLPFCCGRFYGDTWLQFLMHQGDWYQGNFEIWREKDSDNDGVPDWRDKCPSTLNGQKVNAEGCAQNQLDDDKDNVTNDKDQCPNTPPGEKVNSQGCAESQLDDDMDGVMNDRDKCPNTPYGQRVDQNGCTLLQSVRIGIEIIEGREPAEPGERVGFLARIDDNTRATLQSMAGGGWGYEWTVNGRPMSKTSETISFTIPKDYQYDEIKIAVKLYRINLQGTLDYLAPAEKTIRVKKPQESGSVMFQNPIHNGYKIDRCLYYGSQCDKPAADKFCQTKGYVTAKSWRWAYVQQTYILGDGKICKGGGCGGFEYVECLKTGRAGTSR